jgi:hypothetical protein
MKQDNLLKEIVKCIDLAKDGLHGVLLVLSVRNRFSEEENAALEILQTLFGEKILNYMVVIFTGGDELDADGKTFEDYLSTSSVTLQVDFSTFLTKNFFSHFHEKGFISVNYLHK